jgi:hypothetical protein
LYFVVDKRSFLFTQPADDAQWTQHFINLCFTAGIVAQGNNHSQSTSLDGIPTIRARSAFPPYPVAPLTYYHHHDSTGDTIITTVGNGQGIRVITPSWPWPTSRPPVPWCTPGVHRDTHAGAYRATLRCPAGLPPYAPPLRAGQPQQIRRRRRRHRLHFVGAPPQNPTSTHGARGQLTALPPSVGAPWPVVSDSRPWVMFPRDTVPRRRVLVQQQTLPVTTGPTSTPPVPATRTLGGHQLNLAEEYASITDIKTALLPQPDSAVPMAVDEVANVRRSTAPSLTSPPPSAPSSPITLIDQPSAALLRAVPPLLVTNTVFGTPAIRLAEATAAPLTFAAVSVRPNRLQLVWQALERNVPRRSSPTTSSTAGAWPALHSTFAGVT